MGVACSSPLSWELITMEESDTPSEEMTSVNDGRRGELSAIQRLRRADFCPWIPARYSMALLSFLGFFNVYALRVNLSVAIVQMDNSTAQRYPHAARVSLYSLHFHAHHYW